VTGAISPYSYERFANLSFPHRRRKSFAVSLRAGLASSAEIDERYADAVLAKIQRRWRQKSQDPERN
jgi:hypothetical protein